MLNWRNLSSGLLALAASGANAPASAVEEQVYPAKPIRLIAPFAPGGGATQVARMIVPELADVLGQSIVVDNRPGGGGMLGTEIAARSQPDGYTLVMGTVSNIVINPLLSKAPYDPVRDLVTIIHTSTVPLVLVVHPSVAAKSVKELIDLARSAPAKLNFASSGEGTVGHLAGELFKSTAGVSLVHVPYRGGGPAVIDLVGGHVQLGFINIIEALPQVNAGRLRALGVSTAKRSPVSPALPTIAEAGVPRYEVVQWSGVLGPAGLPKSIVNRLNREIAKILTGSELWHRLVASGAEPGGGTPEQFSALVKSDIGKWSQIIKAARLEHVR
jgi:tripartite-type tricarboxylate transporter receptor subunit TctC